MIKLLPESNGNFLAISASDKLTSIDYEKTFIPELEQLLENYEQINVLIFFQEDFVGWEMGAMWDDAKFGLQHKNDFTKIAIVGATTWIEWATKLASYFMPGQVKSFASKDFIQAVNWLSE